MKQIIHFFLILFLFYFINSCKKETTSIPSNSTKNFTLPNDEMVLTPAGWIAKSRVHIVQKGEQILLNGKRVLKINSQTREIIENYGERKLELLSSKGISNNQNILPNPLSNHRNLEGQSFPANINWMAYTLWQNSGGYPINHFSTNWVVPNGPFVPNGQTLFIFNAIENSAQTSILQPVLQWGSAYGGGGNNWEIANWFVWLDENNNEQAAVQLPKVTVTTGTPLTGIMNLNGETNGSYNYLCYFNGYNNSLTVTENGDINISTADFPLIQQLTVATETLEAYNDGADSPPPYVATDYPASLMTPMTGINITTSPSTPNLEWTAYASTTDNYGESAKIISNSPNSGEVDIYYHPALISGGLGDAFSPTYTSESGTIVSAPGYTVHVQVSATSQDYSSTTTSITLTGVLFNTGYSTASVGSTVGPSGPPTQTNTFTFVMPSSGSVNYTAGITYSPHTANNSGSINVY